MTSRFVTSPGPKFGSMETIGTMREVVNSATDSSSMTSSNSSISGTSSTTNSLDRNYEVRRRHFKVKGMLGVRNANRGAGTAMRFRGTKAGRLLLGFTGFAVLSWLRSTSSTPFQTVVGSHEFHE